MLLIGSTIARHHEYTLKGDVIAMPGLPKHLTERALEAAAAAIATGIVSVVMKKGFSHEQGAQKRLLCEKENRLTTHVAVTHVAVSFSEAEKLSREAEIYTEKSNQHNTDILSALKRANPLSRKPYMCQECGALKWV